MPDAFPLPTPDEAGIAHLRPGDTWQGCVLRLGDTLSTRTLDGFVYWRLEADGPRLGTVTTNAELAANAEEVEEILRRNAQEQA